MRAQLGPARPRPSARIEAGCVEAVSIEIPTPMTADCISYCYGRDGAWVVCSVRAWYANIGRSMVCLEGIDERGVPVSGGFWISLAAMDALALVWLKARGLSFVVAAPAAPPAELAAVPALQAV